MAVTMRYQDGTEHLLSDLLQGPAGVYRGSLPVPHTGVAIPATVTVGERPGDTLLVTSGVHGAEYAGIEATVTLAGMVKPAHVRGALVVLHCINQSAFLRHVVDLMPEDGENLNRAFPVAEVSDARASTHTQVMSRFLDELARDYAAWHIDVHSGDAREGLVPHVYYSANEELGPVAASSRDMALHSGMPYAVVSYNRRCFYQNSNWSGVPAVLLEMGQQGRWSRVESNEYANRIMGLARHLGVLDDGYDGVPAGVHARDVHEAVFLEAPCDGRWLPSVSPGMMFREGDLLGRVQDFFGRDLAVISAPQDGVVLYMTTSLSVYEGGPLVAFACSDAIV